MAALLNICTTIEQRGVVRFLWAKNMDATKDIHKEMLPIWVAYATHSTLKTVPSIICTRLFRGKMHSDWFNGIEIL
jgi:hypothetical protein